MPNPSKKVLLDALKNLWAVNLCRVRTDDFGHRRVKYAPCKRCKALAEALWPTVQELMLESANAARTTAHAAADKAVPAASELAVGYRLVLKGAIHSLLQALKRKEEAGKLLAELQSLPLLTHLYKQPDRTPEP